MEYEYPHKIESLFDEATETWSDIYAAKNLKGQVVQIAIPREEQEPEQIAKAFLRKGVSLPSKDVRRGPIAAAAQVQAPIAHRAARAGWHPDGRAFVSFLHVSRSSRQKHVIRPPEAALTGGASELRIQGDLKGWQSFARLAKHSSAMFATLSAVFAAPLLTLVKRPPFALILVGPSRCGKSSAQLLAGSAMGFSREEQLPNMNATSAGLQAMAVAFNDHALLINEVGTAAGSKKSVYDTLRNTTYALSNGQDITRHPTWLGASTLGGATYSSIQVFSSEISPDEWAARNNDSRDPGEQARLISLPVLLNGQDSIFDLPPGDKTGEELKQWCKEQFGTIRQNVAEHRGTAFTTYTDYLISNRKQCVKAARGHVRRFERKFDATGRSAIERDIIGKFAVLYAGAVIAIEAEVLPYKPKRALSLIITACTAALGSVPDPKARLSENVKKLKRFLESPSIIDADACSKKQMKLISQSDGFYTKSEDITRYTVRAELFTGIFKTALDVRTVLEWLHSEGFLETTKQPDARKSNSWAQSQARWPDRSRPRSIVLQLPRGLVSLDII
ncbi:DUF927 domain-containing protein [uncultured Methylobacterium sp.]|jgi:hypothetical protein|uniref:DUF927 domain-containing protein n=1 Tax=uncultured Methylobacterium sp. TaxID=157278 RepID=UPI00261BA782|nr:DUF927 domain-containing protein [uncultured Methylobacterium sp.]